MQAQMLAPAAVLVLWSIVMLVWMAGTRLPALKDAGGISNAKPGGRGQDLEGVLPDQINWKAHNYAHLMEQPTVFYAVVIILALVGASGWDILLAWVYVGLRIVHSIWQATVNKISIRLQIFLLSSVALAILAVRAVIATLFANPGVLV